MFRSVANGMLSGAVCGLAVGGIGGRIAMRMTTLTGGFSDSSVEGTLLWFSISTLLGAALGAVLGALLTRRRARWWVIGLVSAALAFVSIRVEGNWEALYAVGNRSLNLAIWFAVGFGFGAGWSVLFNRLSERRVAADRATTA